MSTTINTGWLKDNNGDKFAPKTLASQVITADGIILEDKIQNDINEQLSTKADVDHNHDSVYETKENAQLKYDELAEGVASKQDTLTGSEGQIVQFNTEGKPVASDLELITIDDIDAICGGSIQYAEEVLF